MKFQKIIQFKSFYKWPFGVITFSPNFSKLIFKLYFIIKILINSPGIRIFGEGVVADITGFNEIVYVQNTI